MGVPPFVADGLASGRLVRPFDRSVDPARAYHLTYPKGARARPALRRVRDWLIGEAAA